ncbi:hypothetical protein [Streptomyces finlayi]|nr:hypothetical protein [Streptomyces finlayi]
MERAPTALAPASEELAGAGGSAMLSVGPEKVWLDGLATALRV